MGNDNGDLTLRSIWALLSAAANNWVDDHAQSMGAALAYYTMFSIAPLLLIVISVAGLMFGEVAARAEIASQLHGLMGEQGASAVQALLVSVNQPAQGLAATVVGVLLLVVGATTVFAELQDSLDRIWHAPPRPGSGGFSGLWNLLTARLLSFGMILGIGFLLTVSLVFSAGLSAVGKWWSLSFAGWQFAATVIDLTLSFVLTTGMFALIYKVMPRVRVAWNDVWFAAVMTATLFAIGKFLIGAYIGRSAVASAFGAAGSLVALLVWVYYSAQIFLLGAEVSVAYASMFGSRRNEIPAAVPDASG
jgi:membrane protein